MIMKACPCVVVNHRILCFEHPYAGNQIPKGTVEVGESIEQATLRELYEESGIREARIADKIGELDWVITAGTTTFTKDEHQRWHLYLVAPEKELLENWTHQADGSQAEEGLVFRYFWQSLTEKPVGFHDVYDRVMAMTARHIGV